jgi:hypothetical protein
MGTLSRIRRRRRAAVVSWRLWPGLLGLVLLWSAGCGRASVGASPSWRGRPSAHAKRADRLAVQPASPGAERYNDRNLPPPPDSELARVIVAAVRDAARSAGSSPPRLDGRLFAVAADLAPIARPDGPIPYELVEFALRHHGLIEPSPHILIIWAAAEAATDIAAQLGDRLPDIVRTAAVARMGVASASASGPDGAGDVIVLVLQPSFIHTDPIPRRLGRNQTIRVEGTIAPPYREPQVFITEHDGQVFESPLRSGPGRRIRFELSCRGHAGRRQVEITALDQHGSAVLANFPVWCATHPPVRAEIVRDRAPAASITDPRAAEREMIALLNRDRAHSGLPALVVDERVSAVARRHSQEMQRTGNVAHISRTTGAAIDRVRAGGIKTALVLENVARAYGVSEAQQGLLNSPGHRANILAPEATHVGVGIALGDNVTGQRELFVTQLFIRIPPPLDIAKGRQQLRRAIADRGNRTHDDELAQVAQQFAVELAQGRSPGEAAKRSAPAVDALAKRFRRVTTVVNPVAELDKFPVAELDREPKMTRFGIGLAQGTHDVIGEGAIYVVVLLGQLP